MSRSCDNIHTSNKFKDRRESRLSDIVNEKEWKRRHKMKRLKSKGFVWRRWIPDQIAHQRPPQPQIAKVGPTKPKHLSSHDEINPKQIISRLSSESIDLEHREFFSISTISSSSSLSSSTSSFIPTSNEQGFASQDVKTISNFHHTPSIETSSSNV